MEKVLVSSRKPKVVVSSPHPVAVREIQLIDRVQEMDVLREAAERAVSGQGGVVFLYGEAGIGKTRLARELGAYARSRGMQVLSGRCPALFRMDGVPPYVLWEEVIKDYMDVCTLEELHKVIGSYPIEVSKLIPELKQKLRLVPESFPLSPEHSRDRLFEAVTQFITNISREKPLLVILDDLQWTDQSSLLLMHYLARGVYRESLLILGAYRDAYVDKKHPLSPVLRELNRERLLQSVSLKRLSFDDVLEMIKQILEQDDVSREFCKLIYPKTRGNPFFVEEVIKSLKEEEVIYREKNKWRIREVSKIKFPETVKDIIKARIDRLDDESQNVLTMASFIGKDFTFEALSGVTDIVEDKLLEIVDKLLKKGLFKHRVIREDVFSFADIIVRDVVHGEVGLLRRKKLHGVVGQALEKVYAEKIDKHLGELALHFLEGGDKDKALDYFWKAGEKAAKVYANSEAASYFQSALKLLKEKEGEYPERGRVLERLGDIKRLVGEYDACLKYWNDALLLWKKLHEKEKMARLHRKMANVLWSSGSRKMVDMEKAEEFHRKALKVIETRPGSAELASLYEDMARMHYLTGSRSEALHWAEKAIEIAEKLDDSEVIASSYTSLGTLFGLKGDVKKAIKYLEKALKISLDNCHMEAAVRIYINLAELLPEDENERAFECYLKGFELAKKIGNIGYISWLGSCLADVYLDMGDLSKAVLLTENSVTLARKAGDMPCLSFSTAVFGQTYQRLGEWDKSEQYYNEALSVSEKLSRFQAIARTSWFIGSFYLDKAEYVKAKEFYEKAMEVSEKAGAVPFIMRISRWAAWTYIELGEIEKAENLIGNLHEFALKVKDKGLIANVNTLRAMLFRAQRRWKDSIKYFEKSLQEHEALNARRWNVYWFAKMILSEYARVYEERNQESDKEKACNLLNQALGIFKKMGAKKDIEKTRSRLAYVETGREMAKPKPVTEVLPSHITTGHKELDDLLFGGIRRNYAAILTSPSCDERDLLIKRFLETGAKDGQITFHLISKASGAKNLAERFQSNFYLFVCNPQADKIIKSLPNVFKLKGVENLTDINIALSSAFRKLNKSPKGPRRACIEIVSDVLLQHHAVQTRRWLNALIPELKSKGFTTLAVMDPEMHSPQEVRAILDLFEGEINIYKKKTKKGIEKFLKIEKMYNQRYLQRELPLKKEKLQK